MVLEGILTYAGSSSLYESYKSDPPNFSKKVRNVENAGRYLQRQIGNTGGRGRESSLIFDTKEIVK